MFASDEMCLRNFDGIIILPLSSILMLAWPWNIILYIYNIQRWCEAAKRKIVILHFPPLSSTTKISFFYRKSIIKLDYFQLFRDRDTWGNFTNYWEIILKMISMISLSSCFKKSIRMRNIAPVARIKRKIPSRINITPAEEFNLLTVDGFILCLLPVINLSKV